VPEAAAAFSLRGAGDALRRNFLLVPIAAGLVVSALDWAGVCTESCAEASFYRLFGMPLPPLGVAYFTACGIACLLRRRYDFFRLALAVLLFGGLGAELVFTWIQKYVIGHWCPMCVGVAFCVATACVILAYEYLAGTSGPISEGERKFDMKRFPVHVALVLLALTVGLGTSALGLKKADAFAGGLTPEMMALGAADSSLEVYVISDWFCPACRVAEPEILKGADLAMKRAKVVFVDYPIHKETLNYIPYNLSLMVREKGKYLQVREALAVLAKRTKEPKVEEVQSVVAPLDVKYVPLDFADVVAGMQYQMSVVQKFKVNGTPAVVVTDAGTGKVKLLYGSNEITSENILKAMGEVSGK